MFEDDIMLQDLILEYLRDNQASISSIHRKLQKEGYKLHRLVVTGYLKALADNGILKEHDIKPSKVYSIRSKTRKQNIYDIVGEEVKNLTDAKKKQAKLAIYTLQKLFHRPIFLEELKRCRIDADEIDAEKIGGEERMQARKLLSRTTIKIPDRNPAYIVKENEEYEKLRQEIMEKIIINIFNVNNLVLKSKQITLNQD
ncbi:MAG: hypothetical protein DRN01_02180 [Thermoplasmata archaeon]|nr:MAG: hypothetical protein DRN01_02180 [Thermoplasmata archaeon]